MAYTPGDTILDDEYNNFVASATDPYGYNHFAGTGSGEYGLGQTPIATVTAGDTITAAQFNSLFTGLINIANHTNDSLTSTTAVSVGDTIAVKAALISDIATLAASVAAGSPNATAVSPGSVDQALSSSTFYDQKHVTEASFTFDGGDEARWFFNAGGKLRVSITNTSTNGAGKDQVLSGLITQMGNLDMGATATTTSGSSEDTITGDQNLGYYDLTTSYQTLYQITESTSSYSASYNTQIFVRVEAKTSAAHADGRGNNGEVVTLRVTTEVDDGVYTNYTSGNVAGVPVNTEEAGPTTHSYSTVDPTTGEGLATVYTNVVVAEVSNTRSDVS